MMDLRKETEDLLPDSDRIYPTITEVEDLILLNVGGFHHKVLWKTLQKFPDSRLGKLTTSKDKKQPANDIYFDRNPIIFNAILDYYRTGKLHFNDEICAISISDELEFWMISEDNISPCCKEKFVMKKLKDEREIKKEDKPEENQQVPTCQSKIWNLLDNPGSSIPACMYYVVSLFFVLLYLLAMTLNTVPSIIGYDEHGESMENPKLALTQMICVFFCTIELILRFVFSPNKCQFLKGLMNIVDLLVILHYFTLLVLISAVQVNEDYAYDSNETSSNPDYLYDYDGHNLQDSPDPTNSGFFMCIRVLRVIWIFKLVRYSTGLQNVATILWSSINELLLLLQVLAVGVFLFGTLAYYAEREEEETRFQSLPESFWWAIITMTTVGYGDNFPYTGLGKLVASFCAIFGVIFMVLPIAIIAINFAELYNKKKKEKEIGEYQKGSNNLGKP